MRFWLTQLIVAAVSWMLASSAEPSDGQDKLPRGSVITNRNVFGLREPAPPPAPPAPPAPKTTVKLTGILNILSSKRAVLVISEQGKQPVSKVLKEGDSEGSVEVLSIDEKEGIVKIKNDNQEVSLNFKDDGVKPPTAAPMPATPVPGVPGQPPVPGAPGSPVAQTPGVVYPGAQPGQPLSPGQPLGTVGGVPNPAALVRPTRTPGTESTGGAVIITNISTSVPTRKMRN